MTSLVVFFSVLAGYVLLVRLVVTIFSEFYSFNGLDNVPVFVLVYGPVVIGFGVTAFFSAGFSNHLATILELRVTARHPERTFPVHV
ncbi:MAG TPA: hypothetical protein VFV92_06390, partial [Candidatus Bathyarchaeia archaeon]|nr:hypothetical protein [Candidatus Bathyarchaeia archaeon]